MGKKWIRSVLPLGLAPAPSPPTALFSPWLFTKGPACSPPACTSLIHSLPTAPLQGPWVEEGEESEFVLPL